MHSMADEIVMDELETALCALHVCYASGHVVGMHCTGRVVLCIGYGEWMPSAWWCPKLGSWAHIGARARVKAFCTKSGRGSHALPVHCMCIACTVHPMHTHCARNAQAMCVLAQTWRPDFVGCADGLPSGSTSLHDISIQTWYQWLVVSCSPPFL